MFKYLVSLFVLCFLLTGCGFHGEMRYTGEFGEYVSKPFAKKLADCKRYTSPAFYYGSGMFEIRRHVIKIKGWSGNSCEVVVDDRSLFSRNDNPETILVPKRFTKDISEILVLAFKEPQYEEKNAVKKALNFCQTNDISDCLIYYSVGQEPVLYKYLSAIAGFFKHYHPEIEYLYDELIEKLAKEKTICDGMITDASKLVKQTNYFANIPDKEIEHYVCSNMKNYTYCRYNPIKKNVFVYRLTEHKGKTFTQCWMSVGKNGVTDTLNRGDNPYDMANRTRYIK